MVILTASLAESGNIYLLDMGQPIRIVDLASKMIQAQGLKAEVDIAIVYTGLRPGERLHELLIAPDEELVATSYDKIFCITCKDPAPSRPMIAQWTQTLEMNLLNESDEQACYQLFSYMYCCNDVVVFK
ncbi:hypothetical protein KDH_28070 [Dictyobacter sp. S3.2.2.5]|uniref:Polysaccharide biosynthesis protein CapD-like domain-containing protein n=2 Tax=Dictyobacter halimunensis TaxID=3026934 RepID=A0ABQ6FNW1_9CHLR|nr:hypothetical protein KDH_28070 [Dictyobacter sp. S3.2.2.5]